MIRIDVVGYRGCRSAELLLDPICLVVGHNAEGKSSAAQAAAAAAVGAVIPVPGIKKTDAGYLLHDGMKAGRVTLARVEGTAEPKDTAEIRWPECEFATRGSPPQASPIAVGRESFLEMDLKGRVEVIAELLKARPVKADLEQALREHELTAATIEATWKMVEDYGWDDAAARLKATGIALKARWEEVAKRRYGSAIGMSWQPEGWDSSFIGATEEQVRLHETRMLTQLTEATSKQAIGAERLAELEKLAAPEAIAVLEATQARLEAASKIAAETRVAATDARQKLPSAQSIPGCPCPWCKKRIEVTPERLGEYRLAKASDELGKDELKKRREAIAYADGALSKAAIEANAASRAAAAAGVALDEAGRAIVALTAAREASADVWSPEAVGVAQREHGTAKLRTIAFVAWKRATELAEEVRANQVLLDALAADGIRQQKLAKAVDLFNASHLKPLCEAAGWRPVAIMPTMAIGYGGRDHRLCSVSEQYRVKTILQVAVAMLDHSAFVVIDGADVLEPRERNALFSMLGEAKVAALVAMTLGKAALAPDLEAAGVGQTLWIEKGTTAPIKQARAA